MDSRKKFYKNIFDLSFYNAPKKNFNPQKQE